jgi:hypothetical protein
LKARAVKKLDPGGPLVENAARIVAVRLDEMRAFAADALTAEHAVSQHDMRIAAKRLRYILETTGICFGRQAKMAARSARELQDVLGKLHDCDVLLPLVNRQLAELRAADAETILARAADASDLEPALAARAPHRTAYRGLEMLLVFLQARRSLLFERFREMWDRQEASGSWERLERLVIQRLEEAREHRKQLERVERARRKLQEAEQDEQFAVERARRAATELADARREESSQRAVWLPTRRAAKSDGSGAARKPRRPNRLAS